MNKPLVDKPTLPALFTWRPGALARSGSALLCWLLLRAIAQASVVVILARTLGATDYGSFVAVVAIGAGFSSLSAFGLPGVLLRDGARSPGLIPRLLGQAFGASLVSTFIFSIAAAIVAILALPKSAMPVVLICALASIESASTSFIELIGRAFQARQHIRLYGAIQTGLPLVRLMALATLVYVGIGDVKTLAWAYVGVSAAFMAAILAFAKVRIGWISARGPLLPLLREGVPFAAGALSARIQAEYNKPLLAQVAFPQVGFFNIAQRVIDLVSLPLLAAQEALWPRLYQSNDHKQQLLKAGFALLAISLLAMAAITLVSLMVPTILGSEYRNSSTLMISLSGLPALAVMKALGCFHLIATGRSQMLLWVYTTATAINVVAASLLIPRHGAIGAAIACYASELSALVTLLCIALFTKTHANNCDSARI